MSKSIRYSCHFEFHKIGQGLFYSGNIEDYQFVYDCGTSSRAVYMDKAIKDDYYFRGKGPLDLLIISHFHQDHVSGIKDLLNKTNGVKRVILPYLFPQQRLVLLAQYVGQSAGAISDDYQSFLINPVRYFHDLDNETEISFIMPGQSFEEDIPDEVVGEPGGNWTGSVLPKNDFPEEIRDTEEVRDNKVTIRSHSGLFKTDIWQFKFYCDAEWIDPSTLHSELKKEDINPDEIDLDINNKDVKERLKKIEEVYYSLLDKDKEENLISLVCCHGPIINKQTKW